MKKVLVLGNSDVGLYKFRKELLKELGAEYEVHFSVPEGDYVELLIKQGAIFHSLEFDRSTKNVLKELQLFKQYKKLIAEVEPSVVLLYTLKPSLYAGWHCRNKKIPYIVNITGLTPILINNSLLGKVILKIYKFVLKSAAMVFFQNDTHYKLFRERKLVDKCELLPGSGVNLTENAYEEYKMYDKIRITYVGRLVPIKGASELLQAIDRISEMQKKIEFRIIGECEKQYEEPLKRMQEAGRLTYYGTQDDIHYHMKESNVIIMPSHAEGMSNVLLEAAACGRPVLATTIPGCRETYIEGETGLGFEKNNPDDMIRCILQFCDMDCKVMENMGRKGREYVEKHFSRTIIIEKYIETINNILKESAR